MPCGTSPLLPLLPLELLKRVVSRHSAGDVVHPEFSSIVCDDLLPRSNVDVGLATALLQRLHLRVHRDSSYSGRIHAPPHHYGQRVVDRNQCSANGYRSFDYGHPSSYAWKGQSLHGHGQRNTAGRPASVDVAHDVRRCPVHGVIPGVGRAKWVTGKNDTGYSRREARGLREFTWTMTRFEQGARPTLQDLGGESTSWESIHVFISASSWKYNQSMSTSFA